METYGEVQVKLHLFLVAALDEVTVPRVLNGQSVKRHRGSLDTIKVVLLHAIKAYGEMEV
jgi:hypothetical protein